LDTKSWHFFGALAGLFLTPVEKLVSLLQWGTYNSSNQDFWANFAYFFVKLRNMAKFGITHQARKFPTVVTFWSFFAAQDDDVMGKFKNIVERTM